MQKRLLFSIFLCLSIICVGFNANAQKKQPPKSKDMPLPISKSITEVENVTFDKTEAILRCPFNNYENGICSADKPELKITSIAKKPENKNLTYYYIVSGGKIRGEGANVIWDFADMTTGTYSIVVGVGNDNIIYGNTITKTIQVVECPICDPVCVCPAISITGPTKSAKPGDSLIFTANVSGIDNKDIFYNYKWTLSNEQNSDGTIISGQGKPQIIVKTNPNTDNYTITATVEIDGVCTCPRNASETAIVSSKQP